VRSPNWTIEDEKHLMEGLIRHKDINKKLLVEKYYSNIKHNDSSINKFRNYSLRK
jgi:hypothetical protein